MPYVTVDGQPLYYRVSTGDLAGRKPPLVLVHGAGGTHMHWPAAMRRLPDWTVYSLDLPGHGRSAGPGYRHIGGYRETIYGFCQVLALDRVVLAGHSMGGAIVLDFARHFPGRSAGLVLVGTGARLRVAPALLEGLRNDFPQTAQLITDWTHGRETPEQMKRLYRQRLLANEPQVVLGDFLACDNFDLREEVASIQAPSLVVCGANDIMAPPRSSEALAAALPRSQLVMVPQAGHMLPLERPEELAEAVARFLSSTVVL
jgi:pimeloyl-ACP methyl ester carboxylesterase